MDRRAWQPTIHKVAKSQIWLSMHRASPVAYWTASNLGCSSPGIISVYLAVNPMVLENTLESPLYGNEIQQVHPKHESLIFIERTDAEAEAPILWPPAVKNWLLEKDPDAGQDWRQEEKGTTKDELVGWHKWLNGHEFEQALGAGDGQGSLVCCNPWACKESDMTDRLNWTELKLILLVLILIATLNFCDILSVAFFHTAWWFILICKIRQNTLGRLIKTHTLIYLNIKVPVEGIRLPKWLNGKESACQSKRHRRHGFSTWTGKIPWRRKWQPTPVFLPGESHGQRSLVGHSPGVTKSQTQLSNWAHSEGINFTNLQLNCLFSSWYWDLFPKPLRCQVCLPLNP